MHAFHYTMRWVYILQCEDNHYYVGHTKRLYRRFWEHQSENGKTLNTSVYAPEKIVAIYKTTVISNFIHYNEKINEYLNDKTVEWKSASALKTLRCWNRNCDEDTTWYDEEFNGMAENGIAECLMIHQKDNWTNIRGGKYVRFDIDYEYPTTNVLKDLPLCDCGLPCDIRKKDDHDYLFFRCAKKNMWDEFKKLFNIDDEPCGFYMEYKKDREIRLSRERRLKKTKELMKNSFWLRNVPICNYDADAGENDDECIECCRMHNLITWSDNKIRLCYDCFVGRNDELSKKYGLTGRCLIQIE